MRGTLPAAIAFSLFFLLSFPSMADPPGQEKGKAKGHSNPTVLIDRDRDGRIDMDVEEPVSIDIFSQGERDLIVDYFRQKSVTTRELPPGIAKKVAQGKPLPPGIAKNNLPPELESRLPVRDGYRRMIVDDDVLLTTIATGVVVDVIENVINQGV